MSDRPSGPIFIDMTDAIQGLPIKQVVLLCNLALNRMSLSDLAEVSHMAGLTVNLNLVEPHHDRP